MSKGAKLRAKRARSKALRWQLHMQRFNQTAFARAQPLQGTDPAKFENHGKYYIQREEQEQND